MSRRKKDSPRLLETETAGPYMVQLFMESGRVRNASYKLPSRMSFNPWAVLGKMPLVGFVRRVEMGVGGMTDEWTRETKK
jgi:hypothetical protein